MARPHLQRAGRPAEKPDPSQSRMNRAGLSESVAHSHARFARLGPSGAWTPVLRGLDTRGEGRQGRWGWRMEPGAWCPSRFLAGPGRGGRWGLVCRVRGRMRRRVGGREGGTGRGLGPLVRVTPRETQAAGEARVRVRDSCAGRGPGCGLRGQRGGFECCYVKSSKLQFVPLASLRGQRGGRERSKARHPSRGGVSGSPTPVPRHTPHTPFATASGSPAPPAGSRP